MTMWQQLILMLQQLMLAHQNKANSGVWAELGNMSVQNKHQHQQENELHADQG